MESGADKDEDEADSGRGGQEREEGQGGERGVEEEGEVERRETVGPIETTTWSSGLECICIHEALSLRTLHLPEDPPPPSPSFLALPPTERREAAQDSRVMTVR